MIRIAVIGIGQIARQQHLPVLENDPDFQIVAAVSPAPVALDVPVFSSLAELRQSRLALDAVALCTPPDLRYALAREALTAGWHVLLEKPPTLTRSQADSLSRLAEERALTLFAAWHSTYAPAVPVLRDILPALAVERVTIAWKENAEKWHPGADWLWRAGALGVFDAGINALSILCALSTETLLYDTALLSFYRDQQAPFQVKLAMRGSKTELAVTAEFDWRHEAASEIWEIVWHAKKGENVSLSEGGARLRVGSREIALSEAREYAGVYRHFATLIRERRSSLDLRALDIVTDALAFGVRQKAGQ
ncbi:Gfo/Idh/MocA family oxidoreductase [Asaia sp. HN010]|uniref:Gfo/Idh/MocA family protein n=1 Tax=Asaia sp. HN010 TaxID=3081233 RepID=UPI003016F913